MCPPDQDQAAGAQPDLLSGAGRAAGRGEDILATLDGGAGAKGSRTGLPRRRIVARHLALPAALGVLLVAGWASYPDAPPPAQLATPRPATPAPVVAAEPEAHATAALIHAEPLPQATPARAEPKPLAVTKARPASPPRPMPRPKSAAPVPAAAPPADSDVALLSALVAHANRQPAASTPPAREQKK